MFMYSGLQQIQKVATTMVVNEIIIHCTKMCLKKNMFQSDIWKRSEIFISGKFNKKGLDVPDN